MPVLKLGCVLCHDAVAFCLRRLPAFCLKVTAFCFKTKLCFASRPSAFCSRIHCDLSQEEDIQCAGSDTRPPMLDRTDFASWQQRIRLYCRGKDNGVNILKSIDEGPYKLGTFRETLSESIKGTPQFGPKRPRVYSDLNSEEKDRYNANIRATNILLQGLQNTYTPSSITIPTRKTFGIISKCSLMGLN
nr:integrase, catalytic region, zinc finger, CCHC-type, peptidase aspartic, catalytic [Tanacetum cinerariifolium]